MYYIRFEIGSKIEAKSIRNDFFAFAREAVPPCCYWFEHNAMMNFVESSLLLRCILLTVEYSNYWSQKILRKNMEKLRIKLKKSSVENVCQIPLEISKPIVDKLFFMQDEELVELFLNLLKRSCLKNEAHLAHPNFVNIISSISPDEARILRYLNGKPFNLITPYAKITGPKNLEFEYSFTYESGVYFTQIDGAVDLLFPENMLLYLTNLSSLGLLTSPYERYDYDIDEHGTVSDCGLEELSKKYEAQVELELKKLKKGDGMVRATKVEFTELGHFFLSSVIKY